MFELISEKRRRSPHGDTLPIVISTATHLLVLSLLVIAPLLYVTERLPEVPAMMAFVAPAPPPPPPPPPPPAPARTSAAARPAATAGTFAAPVEVPTRIEPEAGIDHGAEGGVPGGVEGGVPGGVTGGIIGGLPSDIPPPPPPVVPPAPRLPVRIGGGIQTPALLHRVAPVYPDLAVRAHVEGVVILEAIVDRDGHIEDVRVLRSMPLLNAAALAAVRQWRYSPLLLNGKPERFVLTVTVSFRLSDKTGDE
jgi:protein TonB